VETFVAWLPQYEFDPVAVELSFGLPESPLPAWTLDLGEDRQLAFRGMIDRVDLEAGFDPEINGEVRCVVIDYKSSARKLDPVLLENGIQLQLPAYLSVLRHLPDPRPVFGADTLIPAGVFYVNLRGHYPPGAHRGEVLADQLSLRRKAYQHTGMFDRDVLNRLDNRPEAKSGDQFKYRLKKNGEPYRNSRDICDSTRFFALLDQVEQTLKQFGRRIYAGEAAVDPYQKKNDRPCQRCAYQAVCRIDPWSHRYRLLK
jgi:ATP-dependent helicase/nuclease subunit B